MCFNYAGITKLANPRIQLVRERSCTYSYVQVQPDHVTDLIDCYPSVLPDGLLHEEGGESDEEEHEDVGDEEGAAAVVVGHVGEAPDVAQAHRQAQGSQEEVALVAP